MITKEDTHYYRTQETKRHLSTQVAQHMTQMRYRLPICLHNEMYMEQIMFRKAIQLCLLLHSEVHSQYMWRFQVST